MSILLLVLWPAISAHPLLEHLGLIHTDHAEHGSGATGSHEHDDDDHDAADGQCILTSGDVKVPVAPLGFTPFFSAPSDLVWTLGLTADPDPSGLAPPGIGPPELTKRWQFLSRSALPVRAPSLPS